MKVEREYKVLLEIHTGDRLIGVTTRKSVPKVGDESGAVVEGKWMNGVIKDVVLNDLSVRAAKREFDDISRNVRDNDKLTRMWSDFIESLVSDVRASMSLIEHLKKIKPFYSETWNGDDIIYRSQTYVRV